MEIENVDQGMMVRVGNAELLVSNYDDGEDVWLFDPDDGTVLIVPFGTAVEMIE